VRKSGVVSGKRGSTPMTVTVPMGTVMLFVPRLCGTGHYLCTSLFPVTVFLMMHDSISVPQKSNVGAKFQHITFLLALISFQSLRGVCRPQSPP
jgi:hypothetical protein